MLRKKHARGTLMGAVLMLGLLLGLLLGGCQSKGEESLQVPHEGTSDDATAIKWSPDSDCAACHEDSVLSFSSADTTAALHEQNCTSCHSDEVTLADVHENSSGKSMPTKLKKTSIDDGFCLSCHESYEKLAQTTSSSTVLTDDNSTMVNPHEVVNLTASHDKIDCSSCHTFHSSDSVEEGAAALCASCHHEGVYECGTCH